MKRIRVLAPFFVAVTVFSGIVVAQMQGPGGMPTPRLLYVMPMGGAPGDEVTLTVTGQDLNDADGLHFDFPGAKVEAVGSATAPAMDLKGKKGKGASPIASFKFKVTLPANAPLGIHDVRVVNKWGVSNPRAFVVGDQKEMVEQENNDDVEKAQKVEMNSTINGVIAAPTDVDYYQFAGKKGEHVVLSCLATSIDSKLPAALQLFTAKGALLGFNRAYQNSDAMLDVILPADGDYQVRVFSFAYTSGGPDYSYRLTVSTAPWIEAAFPSVVEPGKETDVTIYGHNLPGGKLDPMATSDGQPMQKANVKVKAPAGEAGQRLAYRGAILPNMSSLDGMTLTVKNKSGTSNPFLLTFAQAPVVKEGEGNDTMESPQKVSAPCEISGRIDKKNDRDWFAFAAKKGDVFSIEVFGDRLGSGMDLYMQVRNPAGNQLAEQDDTQDILSNQLYTRTDDPQRYRLQANADGEYKVLVAARDAFTQFGPRFAYQLRITREQPDFRLVAMPPGVTQPDAATVGQGGHQAWLLHVWRLDGFDEEITLSAEGLPMGVNLKPQVIPRGQKVVPIVVSASPEAQPWTGAVKIVGTASVNGKKLVRETRAATVSWPTIALNVAAISRIDRELVLAVREKAPFVVKPTVDKVTVQQGEKINIPVKLTRQTEAAKGAVILTGFGLPTGMTMQPVTINADKDTATATIDGKVTLQAGTYTIVLRGQTGALPKQNQQNQNLGIVQPSEPVTVIVQPRGKKK